eukprot:747609-Hanusia_phi.AAC.3
MLWETKGCDLIMMLNTQSSEASGLARLVTSCDCYGQLKGGCSAAAVPRIPGVPAARARRASDLADQFSEAGSERHFDICSVMSPLMAESGSSVYEEGAGVRRGGEEEGRRGGERGGKKERRRKGEGEGRGEEIRISGGTSMRRYKRQEDVGTRTREGEKRTRKHQDNARRRG